MADAQTAQIRAQGGGRGAGVVIGWPGGESYGRILDPGEHNSRLRGVEAMRIAAEMRRSDPQIQAVLTAAWMPLRSTAWTIEPPDEPSAAEVEAADLLRENLFETLAQSWDDVLQDACDAIYYGWGVPEIIWREEAGRIEIHQVATRHPELVESWQYDQRGELVGYVYSGNRPVGPGRDSLTPPTMKFERIFVPVEKTLLYTYQAQNGGPQGQGVWRGLYAPWYFKKSLLKIMGVGIERSLLGVPVAMPAEGAQEDDRSSVMTALRRLRAAEDAAICLPPGWRVEWLEASRTPIDAMPFLQYQDTQIAIALLQQHLLLGSQGVGTQAIGTVHAAVSAQMIEGQARWIETTIQRQLVNRWTLLNYGPGFRSPRLSHRPIRARDLASWVQTIQSLAGVGMMHSTPEDEAYMRQMLELPELPFEELEKLHAEPEPAAPGPDRPGDDEDEEGDDGREAGDCEHGQRFSEDDAAAERAERDAQENDFSGRALALLGSIEREYVHALRPLVEEATTAEPMSAGVPLQRLADVAVPRRREYERLVRGYIWSVMLTARETLAGELDDDELLERPVPNAVRSWANARASVVAADHLSRLQSTVQQRVLTGIRAGMSADEILSAAGADAIEELARATERDWAIAAQELLAMVARDQ